MRQQSSLYQLYVSEASGNVESVLTKHATLKEKLAYEQGKLKETTAEQDKVRLSVGVGVGVGGVQM